MNSQYVTGHGDTEELQLQGAAQLGNVGVGAVSRDTSLHVPQQNKHGVDVGAVLDIYI